MNNSTKKSSKIFSLKVLIPIIVFLAAAVGAYATVVTAPKAKMRVPEVVRQTVDTQTAVATNHRVVVDVMGTVTATREIQLEAQVSGKVTGVSPDFVPGGYFGKGQEILVIESKDYELALSEVQAEVTEAEYNLKVEQGYQNVSAREWDMLKGPAKVTEAEASLALRKPHLEKAKADLRAAQAKLEQARIDLARTRITAPFAAMVESKDTDIGAAISEQETLATLVGTDEFWIQASVPVDRLDWIRFPSATRPEGSSATIIVGSGIKKSERQGRVVRLLPSLEDEGRMARILISVMDPLNLEGRPGVKPLLLGSYVSVKVEGDMLEGVFAIPRRAYRDNSQVWILADDGTLDIRTLNPIWKDADSVIVDQGVAPGESIVTSDLAAPMQGMLLNSSEAPAPVETGGQVEENNNG